jgi:hypothetical protein
MEYAADDINYGYMSILMHINSEYTLIDKIENIRELDGNIEHPIFGTNKGGVTFTLFLRGFYTVFEAVMNFGNRFDIYVVNESGNTTMIDEDLDQLISLLHILYINKKAEEDELLNRALNPHTYRKVAKKMFYNEDPPF